LIYCAPYSPDLNPIEPTFHQYKAYLRRHWRAGAVAGQIHLDALRCITEQNMLSYYRAIGCVSNLPSNDEDSDDISDVIVMCAAAVTHVVMSRKRARGM
jgi:hypothetical protein